MLLWSCSRVISSYTLFWLLSKSCHHRSSKQLAVWQCLLYLMYQERKSASVMTSARVTFHRSLPLTLTMSWMDTPTLIDTLQDLLGEENMEVNPNWECLKETGISTCEEVLGKKKRQHYDWIYVETINKLQVGKENKAVLNNTRTRSTTVGSRKQGSEENCKTRQRKLNR